MYFLILCKMAFVKLLLFLVIIKLGIFAENSKENSNFDAKQKITVLSIKKRAANPKNQQNVSQKVIIKTKKPISEAPSPDPSPGPSPPETPQAYEPPVSTAEQTVSAPGYEAPQSPNAGPSPPQQQGPVNPPPGYPGQAEQPQQYGPASPPSANPGQAYPPAANVAQSNQGPAYAASYSPPNNQGPAHNSASATSGN